MSDIVERLIEKAGMRRLKAGKDVVGWTKPSPRFAILREAADEIVRLRTLLSEAGQREKDARAKALEEAAKGCDAVADRPLQGPEHGVWERAERQTAKRLAQSIRALQSEER